MKLRTDAPTPVPAVGLPPHARRGSAWQRRVRDLGVSYSTHTRARRAALFRERMQVRSGDRVLDMGGSDGTHVASLGLDADIYVADVDAQAVERGAERYGFTPVVVPPSGILPFSDRYFDVVFCSSVIEHVTVPPDELRTVTSTKVLEKRAARAQAAFANEIRRVAKRDFVQTPYRYFPVESHTWMPGVVAVLPRPLQIRLIDSAAQWWPKPSVADFRLLTVSEMRRFFPDAEIVRERALGLTKSLIAIK